MKKLMMMACAVLLLCAAPNVKGYAQGALTRKETNHNYNRGDKQTVKGTTRNREQDKRNTDKRQRRIDKQNARQIRKQNRESRKENKRGYDANKLGNVFEGT